jgi:hypothetical protein
MTCVKSEPDHQLVSFASLSSSLCARSLYRIPWYIRSSCRRAEALVTSNTKHFAGTEKRFGISVLSPRELLEKIREGNQNGN